MGVRQENRINGRIWREGNERSRELLFREAMTLSMTLSRSPRQILEEPKSPIAERHIIRSWMRRNVGEYQNETELVEGANCALKLPVNCMDDETHWVWDIAFSIFNSHNRFANKG